jgi:hypothetical protein
MLLANKNHPAGLPGNGWDHWYYESESGELLPINVLRQSFRERRSKNHTPSE